MIEMLPMFNKSVTRINLDMVLAKQFARIKNGGVVLDVGSKHSPYKDTMQYAKYLRLDIDSASHPDIVCDLHDIKWDSDYFDTVIATEVLEHLHEPKKAIDEIHRVLKKGGVCILSTRFMYPYHEDPQDYYRFTNDSLALLFAKFRFAEIIPHGNRLQVMWQIITLGKLRYILNIFNGIFARINFYDKHYPSGFVVFATK